MRDPLIRRLIIGTVLSAVFVFVAMQYFGLRTDEALVFLLSSVAFVIALIGAAWLGALVLRAIRPPPPHSLRETRERSHRESRSESTGADE